MVNSKAPVSNRTIANLKIFYTPVTMPGGWKFDHVKNLKFIDLYYNSQFEKGDRDTRGFKKFFQVVSKFVCDVASKFTDLDTKDFILVSKKSGEDQILKTWIMQREFKRWLQDAKFGITLNDINDRYPVYGHVVERKMEDGKWVTVDLHNIRTNPAAPWLDKSEFVYQVSLMSRQDIKRMNAWNPKAIDTLLERHKDIQMFDIYDCYDLQESGKKWKRTIKGDLFTRRDGNNLLYGTEARISQYKDNETFAGEVVFFEDEVDELPYRELKWEHVIGRWAGRGFMEYTRDEQIRQNEIANLKARGLYWTSLRIYQTQDTTIGKEILVDAKDGDVLRSVADINPVRNEERNLNAFVEEQQRWDYSLERKSFVTDITRGANLPSRTPLGVANIQTVMATSFFEGKRENFGLFVKFLIKDDVLPDFRKKNRKQRILNIASSENDREYLIRALAKAQVNKAAMEYANKTGFLPNEELRELETRRLEDAMRAKKQISLDLISEIYDDVDADIDILVTGEQIDTQTVNTTLNTAMQLVASNPAILQNRITRTMLFKGLEMAGVSPVDMNMLAEMAEQARPEEMMQQLPQGGSIAAPMSRVGQPQTTTVRTGI